MTGLMTPSRSAAHRDPLGVPYRRTWHTLLRYGHIRDPPQSACARRCSRHCVVTLSTASHVLLSRVPLPLNTVAAVAAAVFALAYALAGRERGFGRIAALLVPLELAADTVFTTGQHVCYGRGGRPGRRPAALGRLGRAVRRRHPRGHPAGPGHRRRPGPGSAACSRTPTRPPPGCCSPRTSASACSPPPGCAGASGPWPSCCGRSAATTFRPLLLAVAAVTVGRARRPAACRAPARRPAAVRDRLLVHSLGRRGPPCSVAFA